MEKQIVEYSVGQLAQLSGVSVRTLHYYDEIGLLKPAYVATNGYSYYRSGETLRLQEILFYQGIGMSLREVREMLDGEENAIARLRAHRSILLSKAKNVAGMLKTLDHTIAHLKGERDMTIEELYQPFSKEIQAGYEQWLISTYGEEMTAAIVQSKERGSDVQNGCSAERMVELKDIEARLVAAMQEGLTGSKLDLLFDRHREWVAQVWNKPCPLDTYAGLTDMYLSHPDFIARFETLAEGFSHWLSVEMKRYAEPGVTK